MNQQHDQQRFRIREAQESDAAALVELVRGLAEFEKLEKQVRAAEEDFRKFGFGRERFFRALLAENGSGRAVGFALYFFTFSTFAGKPTLYLEDLFVLPANRGQGIGRALLKRLAGIALQKDCGRMEWAVLDWNQEAIRFYRALGAHPMEDWITFRLEGDSIRKLGEEPAS